MGPQRKKKIEQKYLFRFVCGFILTAICTMLFFNIWWKFVKDHNQTGHLLGTANLGMAVLIYTGCVFLFFHALGGYRIGVNRRMQVVASQVVSLFSVNALEVFISLAITGQYRFLEISFGDTYYCFLFNRSSARYCLL